MRLLPPGAKIGAGTILFEGQDLVKLREARGVFVIVPGLAQLKRSSCIPVRG